MRSALGLAAASLFLVVSGPAGRAARGPALSARDALLASAVESVDRNDWDAAIKTFSKVLEMDPTCADAYYGRGTSYGNKGDHKAAIKDLSEAG